MDYTNFFKDELSKFRLILNEHRVVGDGWRKYMAIKINLLKRQLGFEHNPFWPKFCSSVQPLVRVRDGKIVWHGKQGTDLLAKISLDELNRMAETGKVITPEKVSVFSLQSAGSLSVCFPSENPDVFCPSAAAVFQQLPKHIKLNGLLFEIRMDSDDVRKCYDRVLQCHLASIMLYYYNGAKDISATQERETASAEPSVKKVHGVNKINTPQRSR